MILVLVLFVVIMACVLLWETKALSLEEAEVPIEGLPQAFDGFRIVLLSDMHGRRFSNTGKEAAAVAGAKPDMIAVTGDFVHSKPEEMSNVQPFIRTLTEIAPVYAVSGNHDHKAGWPTIEIELKKAGVNILENTHVRLTRGDDSLILAGVGDPHTGRGHLMEALPLHIDSIVILLAHAPTWFEPGRQGPVLSDPAIARLEQLQQVSLTLAGHTHGGQIKLPFVGALTTASGRLWPETHIEGLSWEGHGWLYITRGIGQGTLPGVRFMARREVTVLTLHRD
jgi:uncharacterized protein